MSLEQVLALRAARLRLDAARDLRLARAFFWGQAATQHKDNQPGWDQVQAHLEALAAPPPD